MTSKARTMRRPSRVVVGLAALSLGLVGLGVTSASAVAPKLVVQREADSATSLDVSWSEVKDAKSYRVRYTTDDDFKKSIKAIPDVTDGTDATLTGLDTGDTYYVQVTALDAKGATLGTSTVMTASTSYPYTSPGDIFATKVTSSSMVLSWKAVGKAPGYLVDVTVNGKAAAPKQTTTNSISLTGLAKDTEYKVKVRAAKGASPLSKSSPTQSFTTSEYALAAPDAFAEGKQRSTSVDVSWDKVDNMADTSSYVVEYSATTTFTSPKTTKPTKSTSVRIGGLRNDGTYYARIWVVDAKNKRITEKSDYILIKSLVPRGSLTGDTDGAPAGDLMAVAYGTSGQAAQQVAVDSNGTYELKVRPGSYKVQVLYVGTGNKTSVFAHTSGTGWTLSSGKTYSVSEGSTTKVDKVGVKTGNVVKGTVTTTSKKAIRDVDVTAISGKNPGKANQEREVIGMVRTDAKGNFTLTGLPDGDYWIRFHYGGTTGTSYKTLSSWQRLDDSDISLKAVLKKS